MRRAAEAVWDELRTSDRPTAYQASNARTALKAAMAPALGVDRLVALRDVLEALDRGYHPQNPTAEHPVNYIRRIFNLADERRKETSDG